MRLATTEQLLERLEQVEKEKAELEVTISDLKKTAKKLIVKLAYLGEYGALEYAQELKVLVTEK
jgi:hypothetical protein